MSCRALDEGLDVPETDVGIVVSSSRSELQRIQRLGRILRRKTADAPARLYYLHLEEVSEDGSYLESGQQEDIPTTRLRYDGEAERFCCPELGWLTEKVLAQALEQGITPDGLRELRKNLELCLVRGDFWLEEEQCVQNRETASSRAQRNYDTACLLLSRARREYR